MINYKCKICGVEEIDKFYLKNKSNCKKCASARVSQRYNNLSPKEKLEYKTNVRKWNKENLLQLRVLSAKARSKRKNIPFNITVEDIQDLLKAQNYKCRYTGRVLVLEEKHLNTLSIDRIDSSLGYTKDNIALVTANINYMKNDMNEKEFLELIEEIYKEKQHVHFVLS
jgi:hypothetical protein